MAKLYVICGITVTFEDLTIPNVVRKPVVCEHYDKYTGDYCPKCGHHNRCPHREESALVPYCSTCGRHCYDYVDEPHLQAEWYDFLRSCDTKPNGKVAKTGTSLSDFLDPDRFFPRNQIRPLCPLTITLPLRTPPQEREVAYIGTRLRNVFVYEAFSNYEIRGVKPQEFDVQSKEVSEHLEYLSYTHNLPILLNPPALHVVVE